MRKIPLFFMIIAMLAGTCWAEDIETEGTIKLSTDFTYKIGKQESIKKTKALALFSAKLKAVNLAAKYLTHKGLLEHYEKKQNEIFCLATGEIETAIVTEKLNPKKKSYYIKIRTEVSIVDFNKAQIKDLEDEKRESKFSFFKEMEQPVSKTVAPAEELSRAYRYIRKKQWRISIIYLEHLEKKYPNWGDIFLAKAIAYYSMNAAEKMAQALKKACGLNNQEACSELLSFPSKEQ